ncbi:hypothetical protein E8E12_005376 [Didymella heteroderae]|uniref:Uncharacterized protein n=1 Tax=Didymella heteroderae TaxID=1769908 RepID=A0A9P4WXL9_9PLEO|nr:hypothetical protein E8E12_005376 [Didymella heteroderae]
MIPVMSYRSGRDPTSDMNVDCDSVHWGSSPSSIHRLATAILRPTASTFALSCAMYGFTLVSLHHHIRKNLSQRSLTVFTLLTALVLCGVYREVEMFRPNAFIPMAIIGAMALSRIADKIRQVFGYHQVIPEYEWNIHNGGCDKSCPHT